MNRLVTLFVSAVFGCGLTAPALVVAQHHPPPPPPPGVSRPPGDGPRAPVEVRRVPAKTHRDWPLKRAPRPVIARPPKAVVRPFVPPAKFLAPIIFGGVVVGTVIEHELERKHERQRDREDYRKHGRDRGHDPGRDRGYVRDRLAWEDSETLSRDEEWTEFTLDCNARGTKLWFEVRDGRAQVDWAEVVFDNGEVQVVDFSERLIEPGMYSLLDFRNGRRVDHVRMVAQAGSRRVRLSLWMEQ